MLKHVVLVVLIGAAFASAIELAEDDAAKPRFVPCTATNCSISVECKEYSFCERLSSNPDNDSGEIVEVKCIKDHFAVKVSDVVGSCVRWENLTQERRDEILADPKCTYCDVIARGECTPDYIYRDSDGNVHELSCPPGTVIDTDIRGCIEKTC